MDTGKYNFLVQEQEKNHQMCCLACIIIVQGTIDL